MKIGVLTDSCSSLSLEFIENCNVDLEIVPLSIIVNGEPFKENIEINNDEVSNHLLKGENLSSSQPTFYDFKNGYKNLKNRGCTHIIALHISGGMSGTFSNSLSSSNEIEDVIIQVIDSRIGASVLGSYVKYAIECIEKGFGFDEIINNINSFISKQSILLVPYNLNQLKKSGRASSMQAIFTSLLNIKIILSLEGDIGTLNIVDKVRSEKKMLIRLEKHINEAFEKGVRTFYLMHVLNKDFLIEWKLKLESKYNECNFIIEDFIPIVSVHTGVGTIAVGYDGNY